MSSSSSQEFLPPNNGFNYTSASHNRFTMDNSFSRRSFLGVATTFILSARHSAWAANSHDDARAQKQLEQLERKLDGRLGVFALDTATGAQLTYRATERFPFCSTFKIMAASAILAKSSHVPGLLQRRIRYSQGNMAEYSPITEKHLADGMTVAELCAAAIQYSDNTAANLLIRLLGGPKAVTTFARSIGDTGFRLDRWETALNTAIPNDLRDTTTPQAMGRSLQRLAFGKTLTPGQRKQLCDWLLGNTTGATRIKAGIPTDWKIGDKTGTGDYGTGNDVGILWPPKQGPVILAIYTTQHKKDAKAKNEIIASVAQVAVEWLGS